MQQIYKMNENINEYLQPLKMQNRAIKLTQISERNRHSFNCSCQMCANYEHRMAMKMMNCIQNKPEITQNCGQHFGWIIKRLILPTTKIINRGLDILIPQICYYKDGAASMIYLNQDHQDFLIFKIGKDKITNTLLQKIFNQRRRKYKDKINKLSNKKKEFIKTPMLADKDQENPEINANSLNITQIPPEKKSRINIETKSAVVIGYTDGSEVLATQNQFLLLLQKRRQDKIWQKIAFIKNYYSEEDPQRGFIIKYKSSQIKYQKLMARAKLLMKIYAGKVIPLQKQYIFPEQQTKFAMKLKSKSLQVYAEYMVYQIVIFIEQFYDQKIQNLSIKVMINELNQFYILQIYHLEYTPLVKYKWTNQIYQKRIEQQENKKLNQAPQQVSEQNIKNSVKYQGVMRSSYEYLKERYGLTVQQEEDQQEKLNNQFFASLYPKFKGQLSQVLKSNIPLQKFRRDFLGIKPERVSLVKPFTSNMITKIHNLSPRLRVTKPRATSHDFSKFNRTTNFMTLSIQSKNTSKAHDTFYRTIGF